MTPVITSRKSEGPLGDVGSERAKACVSALHWRGYDHAEKGAGSLLLPKAIANHGLPGYRPGRNGKVMADRRARLLSAGPGKTRCPE